MHDIGSNTGKQSTALVTLALVSAVIVPQIGVGMSVPSLPSIAEDFHVSISSAQGTLIVYMVGYAISMFVSGLLSDHFGPRRTQLWGLGLAGAAAILAALADHLTTFYVARFIQALGGCVGMVTTRLIVSREYDARDRMKILTTLASAIAITPCVAPLAGGRCYLTSAGAGCSPQSEHERTPLVEDERHRQTSFERLPSSGLPAACC